MLVALHLQSHLVSQYEADMVSPSFASKEVAQRATTCQGHTAMGQSPQLPCKVSLL